MRLGKRESYRRIRGHLKESTKSGQALKTDIESMDDWQKKARYKTGLSIFGSGGVICAVPTLRQRVRLK
jgi:hypothetical protein